MNDFNVKDTPKRQKTLHESRFARDFEEKRETLIDKKEEELHLSFL